MARPKAPQPTDDERKLVEALAAYDIPRKVMPKLVFDAAPGRKPAERLEKPWPLRTFEKLFIVELRTGPHKLTVEMAEVLARKARNAADRHSAVSAMFLLKTRAGWKDQRVEHSGKVEQTTKLDLAGATPEELAVMERFLARKATTLAPANDDSQAA